MWDIRFIPLLRTRGQVGQQAGFALTGALTGPATKSHTGQHSPVGKVSLSISPDEEYDAATQSAPTEGWDDVR